MGTTSNHREIGREVLLIVLPSDVQPDYRARLQQKYPGITIRSFNTLTDDRILETSEVPRHLFQDVTILCAQRLPEASLLPKCHYIQLTAAGPDRHINHKLYKNPSVTVCSSNGVHPPQIAEWAIGTWIAHRHCFFKYGEQQPRGYWSSPHERATAYVQDSAGGRMGILGYGAIGRQCARLAKAMGMDVNAFTARARPTAESRKDDSYCIPGTGDPEGVLPSAWYHGTSKEAVNDFLSQGLDVLVMCLPLTPSTRNIVDKEQFEIMSRRKTFVINVGRGPHINTSALISALENGEISGAALDVTDPEPLPPEHPLWMAPNVFITPHVSWQTQHYFTRVMDIFEQNLGRLSRGEKLLNQIDKTLNY